MEQKAFLVYKDIDIEGLTNNQLGELFKAMIDHANDREVKIDDPEVKGMWREIKKKMDASEEEYKKKCATNKRIALEREARKKANKNVNERERTCTNVDDRERACTNVHLTDNKEQITDNKEQRTDNREQITGNKEQIPPKGGTYAHTRGLPTEEELEEAFISPELAKAFGEWLECRSERKETYPPAAMADDLSRAREGERKYGAKPVIDILKSSFSYLRPVWDKLKKGNAQARPEENETAYLLRRIEEEEAKEAAK